MNIHLIPTSIAILSQKPVLISATRAKTASNITGIKIPPSSRPGEAFIQHEVREDYQAACPSPVGSGTALSCLRLSKSFHFPMYKM